MTTTLAQLFWRRVDQSAERPAQRVKREGTWHTLTWREVGDIVRELTMGLIALGRQRGDSVALMSSSRPEWVQADFAVLSAGGTTIPIYPSYPSDLIAYIVNDSGVKTLIVEDPLQLAKALEVRAQMPQLEQIVVISGVDGPELGHSTLSWSGLRRLGRENADRQKAALAERVTHGTGEDVASIVYTSGTTGPPKGVVQTHANHLAALDSTAKATPMAAEEVHLLFLPLAHAFARFESFLGVYHGLTTAFAESLESVGDNLREVRPHFIMSVPRVYEKVYARILAGVSVGSSAKQRIFRWAIGVGRQVSSLEQRRSPVPATLKLRCRIAHKLVFAKLHTALGGRLRFAVSGGAPLSREIAEFFHAAGILILEGYGLTETCPILTFNRLDRFRFGSVGQAMPGIELRIAADGEILARGPNIAARGYFRQPEATADVFEPSGWFHTGDIGRLDEDGFLFITDRKKDLIVTAGGMNIAPQNLENALKADPFISQAMIYGDRRPYAVALVTLNLEELRALAKAEGVLTSEPESLAKHPKAVERVSRIIEDKNAGFPTYAQVKRFAILATDFTQDNGQLTPTLKVKRRVIAELYHDTIEGLYR